VHLVGPYYTNKTNRFLSEQLWTATTCVTAVD